jgi:peptidoglycan/LPS O-acetylase OafA/YrhL
MIVACLVVSTLTYRLVEEPARRYIKQSLRLGRNQPAAGEVCGR